MKNENDVFGINMKAYCRAHEQAVQKQLAQGGDLKELLRWHEQKITWLQHERLVHLLVTVLTAAFFLFSTVLGCTLEWNVGTLLFSGILMILLAAYLLHYFRLENTVQHWYRIAEQLHERIYR